MDLRVVLHVTGDRASIASMMRAEAEWSIRMCVHKCREECIAIGG